MIKIFAVHLQEEEEFKLSESRLLPYVQETTRTNISKYKSAVNRQRKIAGEALANIAVRKCFRLPEHFSPTFFYSEKGKPYISERDLSGNNIFFNISHSGQWIICGVSDRELGIDIEEIKKAKTKVAERFFTKEECDSIAGLEGEEQDRYFYLLWTVKESYLKYLGTGLTKPLNSFNVVVNKDDIRVDESTLSASLKFSNINIDSEHTITVCSHYLTDKVEIIEL